MFNLVLRLLWIGFCVWCGCLTVFRVLWLMVLGFGGYSGFGGLVRVLGSRVGFGWFVGFGVWGCHCLWFAMVNDFRMWICGYFWFPGYSASVGWYSIGFLSWGWGCSSCLNTVG